MTHARPGRGSLARFAAAFGLLVGLAGLLGACGGDSADALGKKACASIEVSLREFHESTATTDPNRRATLVSEAADELEQALHPAELAAAASGDWQALGATLEELQHGIGEANLVTALTAQCASSQG